MRLEFEAMKSSCDETYPLAWIHEPGLSLIAWDWRPMIQAMHADLEASTPIPALARKFHNTLAQFALEIARTAGEKRVTLSGGCFQNKLLSESIEGCLTEAGFEVFRHKRIPPNDGGLAAGQIYATLFENPLKLI